MTEEFYKDMKTLVGTSSASRAYNALFRAFEQDTDLIEAVERQMTDEQLNSLAELVELREGRQLDLPRRYYNEQAVIPQATLELLKKASDADPELIPNVAWRGRNLGNVTIVAIRFALSVLGLPFRKYYS